MRIKSIVASMLIGMLFLSGGVAGDEPQKKVMNYLAVMDLNCGTALNKEGCTALTNVVIAEIVKIGKYKVVDRANRDKILSEAGFQQTGCVDESCTIEMGRQFYKQWVEKNSETERVSGSRPVDCAMHAKVCVLRHSALPSRIEVLY